MFKAEDIFEVCQMEELEYLPFIFVILGSFYIAKCISVADQVWM